MIYEVICCETRFCYEKRATREEAEWGQLHWEQLGYL